MNLLFILIYSAFPVFAEDSCSCPVVQCDPCQRVLRLGTEEMSCGMFAKKECEKLVCENVDNYFQCLAGERPLYIPPQNPVTRITEPVDPFDRRPQPIDFEKLGKNVIVQKNPDKEWSMEPKEEDVETPRYERQLASLDKTVPHKLVHWKVSKVQGKIQLKKSSVVALRASVVQISVDQAQLQIKMTVGSELEYFYEDETYFLQLKKGNAFFEIKKPGPLFVSDLGYWRFGKKQGSFGLSRGAESTTLMNDNEVGYLRRDELISPMEMMPAHQSMTISDEMGILALNNKKTSNPKKLYQLQESSRKLASEASGAFCQAPQGDYQQCAWKCFGANSKKDKKCRAESNQNAQCVRFTCSADGKWKLPTFVSSSECSVALTRVGSCQ